LGNWQNTAFTPEAASSETELRTHNKLNQVTAFGVSPTSASVLYDGTTGHSNGNFKNDGTRAYAYDTLNRLVQVNRVSDSAIVGAYTYDAIGRRIPRTISNGGLSGDLAGFTALSCVTMSTVEVQ
jgi:YD repeat-containing protein